MPETQALRSRTTRAPVACTLGSPRLAIRNVHAAGSCCVTAAGCRRSGASPTNETITGPCAYFNSLRELGRALVLMQDDVPVSIRQLAARRGEPGRTMEAPAELTSRVPSYEIRDMLDRLNKPATDPESVDLLVASNMISVEWIFLVWDSWWSTHSRRLSPSTSKRPAA